MKKFEVTVLKDTTKIWEALKTLGYTRTNRRFYNEKNGEDFVIIEKDGKDFYYTSYTYREQKLYTSEQLLESVMSNPADNLLNFIDTIVIIEVEA